MNRLKEIRKEESCNTNCETQLWPRDARTRAHLRSFRTNTAPSAPYKLRHVDLLGKCFTQVWVMLCECRGEERGWLRCSLWPYCCGNINRYVMSASSEINLQVSRFSAASAAASSTEDARVALFLMWRDCVWRQATQHFQNQVSPEEWRGSGVALGFAFPLWRETPSSKIFWFAKSVVSPEETLAPTFLTNTWDFSALLFETGGRKNCLLEDSSLRLNCICVGVRLWKKNPLSALARWVEPRIYSAHLSRGKWKSCRQPQSSG